MLKVFQSYKPTQIRYCVYVDSFDKIIRIYIILDINGNVPAPQPNIGRSEIKSSEFFHINNLRSSLSKFKEKTSLNLSNNEKSKILNKFTYQEY